jgi:hypothetical protein
MRLTCRPKRFGMRANHKAAKLTMNDKSFCQINDIKRKMVGERGFEPPAPASRRQCSTRLSYSPTDAEVGAVPTRQAVPIEAGFPAFKRKDEAKDIYRANRGLC